MKPSLKIVSDNGTNLICIIVSIGIVISFMIRAIIIVFLLPYYDRDNTELLNRCDL